MIAESAPPLVALVVDDEPLIRLPVSWALEERGFEILEAGSGDEALALLEDGLHVDLLITDVRMPGSVDGFELVDHARRLRGAALPIIVMSGLPRHPAARPSPIPGGFIYLQKPASLDQLLGAIATLLAGRWVPASSHGSAAGAITALL
jgi:CheY-like chemotaxis protein